MIGSQDWVVPVGFEVFTVVVMESSLFWDIMPYDSEEDMASIFMQVASSEDGGSLFLQNMVDCQWTTEYYVPEHTVCHYLAGNIVINPKCPCHCTLYT
jgi:hypothetical protein